MTDTTGRLGGRRILVVEDECILGQYFCDLLRGEGCIVSGPVSTVADALQALGRQPFDAAILDLSLRDAWSLEIAERLVRQGTPFVIVSGYREALTREPVLCDAPFLEKPFTAGALISALAGAVASCRAPVAA